MKNAEVTVGTSEVVKSASPSSSSAVVFEDDGQTGYFYAVDTTTGLEILEALHVYTVNQQRAEGTSTLVTITWSADGTKSGLWMDGNPVAAFDFANERSWCKLDYPRPNAPWARSAQIWNDIPEPQGVRDSRRPRADQVARRSLCLEAFFRRGWIERESKLSGDVSTAHQELAQRLNDWLMREGLWPTAISTREIQLLQQPVGSWSKKAIIHAGWRAESLGTLAWALTLYQELPPYDRQFQDDVLHDSLPVLAKTVEFVERARLRARDEIDHARGIAQLWHWRARQTQLVEQGKVSPKSSRELVSEAATHAYELGLLPSVADDDLPAFEKPFRYLDESEHSTVMSVARERHFALNWLSGYSQDWDLTPTDT